MTSKKISNSTLLGKKPFLLFVTCIDLSSEMAVSKAENPNILELFTLKISSYLKRYYPPPLPHPYVTDCLSKLTMTHHLPGTVLSCTYFDFYLRSSVS